MPTTISQEFPFSQIPNWVILNTSLTPHDKIVYMAIATHADRQRTAFPGIRRIAEEAGCSPTTVQKAINNLETAGALVVSRKKTDRNEVNHYRLPMNPVYHDVTQGVPAGDTPPVPAGGTELYPPLTTSNKQEVAKRDEWWDTLAELLGKPTKQQKGLHGRLVARIKADGHPPEEILLRAERLASMWGPEKLTLASLEKHWERMGVPLAGITKQQIAVNARQRELAEAIRSLE